MLVDQKKLDFYVEKHLNVLFEGERGVGKTSVICKTFEKAGFRVKYFSAPTMDPWTDLVGVPSTVTRPDGREVLRLIQPEDFVDDKYDVIFIDELNRAPKKVMNALMELIQFKTINGKPYNIKMIWAAINPHNEDDEYHVEPLDPAVKDRFQIQIKFPYKVDSEFFKKHYGQVGEIFCSWWDNQPEKVQKEISPRRLFDAVGFHMDGGDFEDMITVGNTEKLREDVKAVSQLLILEKDFNQKTVGSSKSILSRNYSANVAKYFKSSSEIFEFFLPHMDKEWVAKEFTAKNVIYDYVIKATSTSKEVKQIAEEIITDIVSVNPGKNPFVKRNLEDLGKYLSEEDLGEYTIVSSRTIPDLTSKNIYEGNLISTIMDKKLMEQTYALNGVSLKNYSPYNIRLISEQAVRSMGKGGMSVDRCKEQISERIGAVLALVMAQGKMNASIKKTVDALTETSDKHYEWKKNGISPHFHDMGDLIKDVMTKYAGMTPDEIKQDYKDMTTKVQLKKVKSKSDSSITSKDKDYSSTKDIMDMKRKLREYEAYTRNNSEEAEGYSDDDFMEQFIDHDFSGGSGNSIHPKSATIQKTAKKKTKHSI